MSQSKLIHTFLRLNRCMFRLVKLSAAIALLGVSTHSFAQLTYTIVDTNQTECSGDSLTMGSCRSERAFGQDAQYQGYVPSYTAHGDGTVTDNNTGLVWAQTTDLNGDGKITADDKVTYDQGIAYASSLKLGGHNDWRVPTIKELYSLMLFDGEDPSGINGAGTYSIRPFIDHSVFGFESGDMDAGERLIDSQYLSSTKYVSTTMNGDETIFGVNFIDGRIKGYGATSPRGGEKTFYLLTVRGNNDYGVNNLVDNRDKTVTDKATGLTWQQGDSQQGMDWFSGIQYCENLELAGKSDWRMPNIKELQSIVDYSRSPDTTSSAAIDSVFEASTIINEGQKVDYANYWSSTTHANLKNTNNAAYIAFGRSLGYINGEWIDVHGAGAQRSDPKQYNGVDYPQGHGPQGDAVRYENFVRCVTDQDTQYVQNPTKLERETKQYTLSGSATNADSQKKDGRRGRNPMADMDSNGDGKLSKSEVRGPLRNDFSRIDRNNDGFISGDEIPQRPVRK
ncbi:DUF1566 domain-containing protein [Vibrio sp. DNB22_10_4]